MTNRSFGRGPTFSSITQPIQWHVWRALILVVFFHLIGTTWARTIVWDEARVDLALCSALCIALLGGWEVGVYAGALAGILTMWTAWWHPGSQLFSHVLPPLLMGLLATRARPLHPLVPPLCGALGALIADAGFVLLSPGEAPLGYWLQHAPRFAALQALAMWPVMACIARVAKGKKRALFG